MSVGRTSMMRRRGVEYCCALAIKVSERWRIPETTIWTLSSLVHCTSLSALHCTTLLRWVGPQCTVAVYLGAFYHKLLKSAVLSSANHHRKDLHPRLHFTMVPALASTALQSAGCNFILSTNVSPAFCKLFIAGQKIPNILVTLWRLSEFDTAGCFGLVGAEYVVFGHNVVFRFEKEECLRF